MVLSGVKIIILTLQLDREKKSHRRMESIVYVNILYYTKFAGLRLHFPFTAHRILHRMTIPRLNQWKFDGMKPLQSICNECSLIVHNPIFCLSMELVDFERSKLQSYHFAHCNGTIVSNFFFWSVHRKLYTQN